MMGKSNLGYAAVVVVLLAVAGWWWLGTAPQLASSAATPAAQAPEDVSNESTQETLDRLRERLRERSTGGDIAGGVFHGAEDPLEEVYTAIEGVYELAAGCSGVQSIVLEVVTLVDDAVIQSFDQQCDRGQLIHSELVQIGGDQPIMVRALSHHGRTAAAAWQWSRVSTVLPPDQWNEQAKANLADRDGVADRQRRLVAGEMDATTVRLKPGSYDIWVSCMGTTTIQLTVANTDGWIYLERTVPCVDGADGGPIHPITDRTVVTVAAGPVGAVEVAWVILKSDQG